MFGNIAANGGAIFNVGLVGGSATLNLGNTILAGSSSSLVNDGGSVVSEGYNLSSDPAGGFLMGAGDQTQTDPRLGPLQDNGGRC